MINQVILIGSVINIPELHTLEDNRVTTIVMLAVDRLYQDHLGDTITDVIPIVLWSDIASTVVEKYTPNIILGVSASLVTKFNGDDPYLIVVARKVAFLSEKGEDFDA